MRPSPPIGEGDILRTTDTGSAGAEVSRSVQAQLSGSVDVKAAHAYFQPTGAEAAHLPAFSGMGSETVAMHAAAKMGEGAAMQAGASAISPMIQMIMRMPGHLGLMHSFFEFLGQFFMGQDILAALDPTHLLAQHAASAMHSLSHFGNQIGNHLTAGIHMMPHDAVFHGMADVAGGAHGSLLNGMHGMHDAVAKIDGAKDFGNLDSMGKDALNNSGYVDYNKVSIDKGADINSSLNDGALHGFPGNDQQYLAWDSGANATFRPTLTAGQAPTANVGTDPASAALNNQYQQSIAPSTTTTSHAAPDLAKDATPERGSLIDGKGHTGTAEQTATAGDTTNSSASATTTSDTTVANAGATTPGEAQPATIDYTVKHGDNLWDIARKHMGDGTKWGDLYKMNQDLIGANPRLIHEGATLHLPGDSSIASNYVVKPGDNLWNISKSHLGAGQNWPEIYHANQGLIGSNPNLIHPGQHLTMSGDSAGQLASADVGSHVSAHAGAHAHTLAHADTGAHAGGHAHQLAHADTSNAHAPAASAHAGHHSVHVAQAHTPSTEHIAQADTGHHAYSHSPASTADHAKLASTQGVHQSHAPAAANSGSVNSATHVPTVGAQVALHAQPAGSLSAPDPASKFNQISGDAQ